MYLLAIDQSTQGTKALLLDDSGEIVCRADRKHQQLISSEGWVSHDLEEIYENVCKVVRDVVITAEVSPEEIAAVGITNQRETTAAWDTDGTPLGKAIVWQCARAKSITDGLKMRAPEIFEKTGEPLSPYFSAAKMAWILQNGTRNRSIHLGTIDSYLVYRLTEGNFVTDYSNAARTQLFNLHTLQWDEEICAWFGIPIHALPQVQDSNACYGYTDFQGFLPKAIPILAVLGDSNGALFGQGCLERGQTKVTYGTGSSIMMNIGPDIKFSSHGLATSLAWRISGETSYVLEGNVNYTGAIISWLQNDLGMISSVAEVETALSRANPDDTSYLVPAFSGLSAPYWDNNARAILCGMSRTTGKPEIIKAAVESIAYQINDVLQALQGDSGYSIRELRADGGASRNAYLMQFQSDISQVELFPAAQEELSAIGVAYLAGISAGVYSMERVLHKKNAAFYRPQISDALRNTKCAGWHEAIKKATA